MIKESYIMQFTSNDTYKVNKQILKNQNIKSYHCIWPELNIYKIFVSDVTILKKYKERSFIKKIFLDKEISFRKSSSEKKNKKNNKDKQWFHKNINTEKSWDISSGGVTKNGYDIHVTVLDDGFYNHKDLQDIYTNNNFDNKDKHGTHVVGLIANNGKSNFFGVNKKLKIIPLFPYPDINNIKTISGLLEEFYSSYKMRKDFNESKGEIGKYIVSINSSWGFDYEICDGEYSIFNEAYELMGAEGILNCGATINKFIDVDSVGDIPSTCKSDFLITVTNSDESDNIKSSGYGKKNIDISAPGNRIYSTSKNDEYTYFSGTSMSTPQVTGTIALMYSCLSESIIKESLENPSKVALDIKNILIKFGVDKINSQIYNKILSGGRLNVHKSLLNLNKINYEIEINLNTNINWDLIGIYTEINSEIVNFYNLNDIYSFNETYFKPTTLENFKGYWIKSNDNKKITIKSKKIQSYKKIFLESNKWHLISGLSGKTNIITESNYILYEYTINGYKKANFLFPGKGYWIRLLDNIDSIIELNLY